MDPEEKARFADVALRYGASIEGLPIAKMRGHWLPTTSLSKQLRNLTETVFINGNVLYDDDVDNVLKWEFEKNFKPKDDLLFLPFLRSSFQKPEASNLGKYVLLLCEIAWGRCESLEEEDRLVGHVNGVEIRRDVTVFRKGVERTAEIDRGQMASR